ncbi:hypothetical protein L596_025276 [Steinernema carpocapsae]|uniref:Core Histone H2A/H2B/H3 domain-containing protein n=1 Tax=Steinernema carpocapsae TaxID=34508 RepID=A0A4V5ZYR6_STECR|nr:hypothetical protein L596_025276 [Steinernema carpocapsae]
MQGSVLQADPTNVGSERSGFVSNTRQREDNNWSEDDDAASGFVEARENAPSEASSAQGRAPRRQFCGCKVLSFNICDFRLCPPSRPQTWAVSVRDLFPTRGSAKITNNWSEDDDAASGFVEARENAPSEASVFVAPRGRAPRRSVLQAHPTNMGSERSGFVSNTRQRPDDDWSDDDDAASGFVGARRTAPIDVSGFVERRGRVQQALQGRPQRRVIASPVGSIRGQPRLVPRVKPKPKKWKSKAIAEIRKYQRSGIRLLPRAPFSRLVREICQDIRAENYRFTMEAMTALQEASEAYLVTLFSKAQSCALHASRVTIKDKDMRLAMMLADMDL